MPAERDYLREAKGMELIGGLFGWVWLIGTGVSIVWFLGAAFGDFSWLVAIGIFLGSQFAKAVARSYQEATQQTINEGISAGYLVADGNSQIRKAV